MHIHLSFMQGLVTFLYMLVFFGALKLLALKFQGHPAADAIIEIY